MYEAKSVDTQSMKKSETNINNDKLLEHSFPAPLVYLLSHTLIHPILIT